MSGNALWQFEWRAELAIGDAAIDAQHRAFFTDAEQIRAAVTSDEPKARILDYCARFQAALRTHFHDEEQLMGRLGFPELRSHGLEHSRLLAQTEETIHELERATCLIDCLLGTRALLERLAEHIARDDAKIRAYTGDGTAHAGPRKKGA